MTDVRLYAPPDAEWLVRWLVNLPEVQTGMFYRQWVRATTRNPFAARFANDGSALMVMPAGSVYRGLKNYSDVKKFKREFLREVSYCTESMDPFPRQSRKVKYHEMVFFIVFGTDEDSENASSAGSNVSEIEATGPDALRGY